MIVNTDGDKEMSEQTNTYKLFLKEMELQMHQNDVKDNHTLSELVKKKGFELNIHPKLATALVNFFWSGYNFGLGKSYSIMVRGKYE